MEDGTLNKWIVGLMSTHNMFDIVGPCMFSCIEDGLKAWDLWFAQLAVA